MRLISIFIKPRTNSFRIKSSIEFENVWKSDESSFQEKLGKSENECGQRGEESKKFHTNRGTSLWTVTSVMTKIEAKSLKIYEFQPLKQQHSIYG